MVAEIINESEWSGALLCECVYFELHAPQEIAVQQGTASGACSGRRGRLAALGQLPGSWIWSSERAKNLHIEHIGLE